MDAANIALALYPILIVVIGFFMGRLVKQIDTINRDNIQMKIDIATMKKDIEQLSKKVG